ncbi:MAG: GHKL domain-containing protein [Oscillospiraceae bacterium]|nr:GHKL domain-containing protein [Oscillospiraceae bacterium]
MGMNACGLPEFLAEILIELIKFWLIMCGILEFRISKSKKVYIAALSVLLIVVFALYVIEFMNPISLGILSTLLFGIIITGKRKVLWTILTFFTICSVDEICLCLSSRFLFSGEVKTDSVMNSFGIIIFSMIALIKYFLVRNKKINNSENMLDRPELIVFVILQMFVFLFVSQYNTTDKIKASNTFFTIIILVFIAAEIMMLYNWCLKKYYQNTSEINRKLLESTESYYKRLLAQEQETRRFRHDIRNHLLCLDMLLKSKKYEEAEEYLEGMSDSVSALKPVVKTGNMLINAMVGDIKSRYPNVSVKWNGHIPDKFCISDMDVCTIFSNLLGNAFENAGLSEENAEVKVTVKILGSIITAIIQNNIAVPVKEKNGRFETHKKDVRNHGIGLQNVERCIKSLNGEIQYSYDDNLFTVEIIIPEAIPTE